MYIHIYISVAKKFAYRVGVHTTFAKFKKCCNILVFEVFSQYYFYFELLPPVEPGGGAQVDSCVVVLP